MIQANCDVVLEQMCGEMDVDNWSEKRWKQIFEESDVCVMTAQIFLDTLYHGFLSLERVKYRIFYFSRKESITHIFFFSGSYINF